MGQHGVAKAHVTSTGVSPMSIVRMRIDLSKNTSHVHTVDAHGRAVLQMKKMQEWLGPAFDSVTPMCISAGKKMGDYTPVASRGAGGEGSESLARRFLTRSARISGR